MLVLDLFIPLQGLCVVMRGQYADLDPSLWYIILVAYFRRRLHTDNIDWGVASGLASWVYARPHQKSLREFDPRQINIPIQYFEREVRNSFDTDSNLSTRLKLKIPSKTDGEDKLSCQMHGEFPRIAYRTCPDSV